MCIIIQDYISQFLGEGMLLVVTAYTWGVKLLVVTANTLGGKLLVVTANTWRGKLLVVTARNNSQISLKKKTTLKLNTKWRYIKIRMYQF